MADSDDDVSWTHWDVDDTPEADGGTKSGKKRKKRGKVRRWFWPF